MEVYEESNGSLLKGRVPNHNLPLKEAHRPLIQEKRTHVKIPQTRLPLIKMRLKNTITTELTKGIVIWIYCFRSKRIVCLKQNPYLSTSSSNLGWLMLYTHNIELNFFLNATIYFVYAHLIKINL